MAQAIKNSPKRTWRGVAAPDEAPKLGGGALT